MKFYLSTIKEDNELLKFFEELKEVHVREKHDFVWEWDHVKSNPSKSFAGTRDFLHWVAFNLSKNILHGPLPDHLHSRMFFEKNNWTKKYFEYLEGKIS